MTNEVVDILDIPEGTLRVEWALGLPFIHLELNVWSRDALREYKRVWEDVKKGFKEQGHDTLYVVIPTGDDKLLRFERMFGFEIGETAPDHYVMYQEI